MRTLIFITGIAVFGLALGTLFRVPMLLCVSGLQITAFIFAGSHLDWTAAETGGWTVLALIVLHVGYLAGLILFRSSGPCDDAS